MGVTDPLMKHVSMTLTLARTEREKHTRSINGPPEKLSELCKCFNQ